MMANIFFILVYLFDLYLHGRDTDPNDVPFLNDGIMIFLVVLAYGILSLIQTGILTLIRLYSNKPLPQMVFVVLWGLPLTYFMKMVGLPFLIASLMTQIIIWKLETRKS
jgi:hypothetical protein